MGRCGAVRECRHKGEPSPSLGEQEGVAGALLEDCRELPHAAPALHRSRKHPSYAAKPLKFLLLVCLFDDLPVPVLQQPPVCVPEWGNGPRNPAHASSANMALHRAEELIRPL